MDLQTITAPVFWKTGDFWLAVLSQLPRTILAFATLVASLATFWQSYKNGRKTELVSQKADEAAVSASSAVKKTEELHFATRQISEQAKQIAEQTDGQLSALRAENKALHETLTKIIAIVSAREGKADSIRHEDLDLTIPAIANGETAEARERRKSDRRKDDDDHSQSHT